MSSYGFIVSAVIISTGVSLLFAYGMEIDHTEITAAQNQEYVQKYQSVFALILSFAIIVPTALVIYRLSWKGTSMELKKKVCRRHLVYFLLFFIYLLDIMHEYFLFDMIKHK